MLIFLQGLGGLQSLDLSLNGLSSVPLGLLDELQSLRYKTLLTSVPLQTSSVRSHY